MRQMDLSRPTKIEWKGGVMQLDWQPYPIKGGVVEALKILVGLVRVPPDRWVLRDEAGSILAVQEAIGAHEKITISMTILREPRVNLAVAKELEAVVTRTEERTGASSATHS